MERYTPTHMTSFAASNSACVQHGRPVRITSLAAWWFRSITFVPKE